jgi:uroporphyrinogen decarboxylase
MTNRELVIETLAHRNPGKVPQAIHLTGEGYQAYGETLLRDYPNKQVRQDYEAGIINLAQAVSLSIGNHILHVYPPWWNWWNLTDVFLKEPDPPDYLPDTRGTGSYEGFFKQMAFIREHYDVYVVATIWGSHWEKAYFARSIENFLADLAGNTEWAQSLLDFIIRKNLVMLENFLTAPEVDAVLLGSDWGTQQDIIMSPDCFRTMIKPGEKQEYDLIKKYGKQVFIHSCGNILRLMGDLVELGVDCLNPVQPECMDLESLKNGYGDRISFYGGISTQKTLPYGTPAEVQAETRRVIEIMSRDGGYLTAPSQQIQTDVPYKNLRALVDTAGEYWRQAGRRS